MLSVFVCEDNQKYLERITNCIKKFIVIENFDMKVACATASPDEVLDYLRNNSVSGLYFLDVDLKCDMTGIQLAEAIRVLDPRGFIVFITVDAESLRLTFKYKVEALDYIVKGDNALEKRIHECIRNAYDKYTARATPLQRNFKLKLSKDSKADKSGRKYFKDSFVVLEYSKILCFAKSNITPHGIVVYTDNIRHEFRGSLAQVESELDNSFVRCHKSFIVNVDKIVGIDTKLFKLQLINGDVIDVSMRQFKKIKELFNNRQNN